MHFLCLGKGQRQISETKYVYYISVCIQARTVPYVWVLHFCMDEGRVRDRVELICVYIGNPIFYKIPETFAHIRHPTFYIVLQVSVDFFNIKPQSFPCYNQVLRCLNKTIKTLIMLVTRSRKCSEQDLKQ